MRDGEERWEGGGDELLLLPLEMDGGALGNSAAMMIAAGHVRGSASAWKHRGIESINQSIETAEERLWASKPSNFHHPKSTTATSIEPASSKYSHTPPFDLLNPWSTTLTSKHLPNNIKPNLSPP